MTRGRLLLGLVVASLAGTVVVIAVRRLRRRLVPRLGGPEALLADIVLVVSLVTVVAEVLGAVGWFAPWPLAVSLLAVAAPVWQLGRVGSGVDDPADEAARSAPGERTDRSFEPGWSRWVVAVGAAAVGVGWLRTLPPAYRHGIIEWDSVWYHLPAAADFVQSGSFGQTRIYGADIAVATYPFGSEVFHAIGMLVTGSDIASPLLNIAWAGVFVIAAHVFGRRHRCPHLATLAALVILATPVSTALEAATGMSEMMGLAMLMAAAALAVPDVGDESARGRAVVVGAAIGLAAAAKLTMLGPAAALFVGVIVIVGLRDRRMLRGAVVPLGAATLATGGFWYLRNTVLFGSPIPEVALGLGPVALGHVQAAGTFGAMAPTLVEGLLNGGLYATFATVLGPLWSWYLVAPLAVLAVVVRSRRSALIVLGVVSTITFVSGTAVPGFLLHGEYVLMSSNSRYLLPGIALALVVGATAAASSRRGAALATTALVVLLASAVFAVQQTPLLDASPEGQIPSGWLLVMLASVVSVTGLWFVRSVRSGSRPIPKVAGGVAGAGVVALLVVQPTFIGQRFRDYSGVGPGIPGDSERVFAWAQTQRGLRIAVQPYAFADYVASDHGLIAHGNQVLLFTYPFYGQDLSNRVEPVARFDGTRVVPPATCEQWWDELRRFRATHVVVWDPGDGSSQSRYRAWTERSPSAKVAVAAAIGRSPAAHLLVYRVDPGDPPRCRS